jgi:peroxiredoxin
VEVVDTAGLVRVLEQARGKDVVVVNFWATWCPPCVKEMPVFVELYRTYASKGVRLVSVSVDHPDTLVDRVQPFVKTHALPFPVYVLSDRSPDNVDKALGVDWGGAVPATFVFDAAGRLKKAWFEDITAREVRAVVESARGT